MINLQILPYKCWVMQKYIFGFIYWHSILGWYGQQCHNKCNNIDHWHYICLAHAVDTISNADKDRLRIIHLARKMPCRIRTWLRSYTHGHHLSCSLNFTYCLPCRCCSYCTVHSGYSTSQSSASGSLHDAVSICISCDPDVSG